MKIILAQGNPEPAYSDTRHNVGFAALNGTEMNSWSHKPKFHAFVAEVTYGTEKVLLVKPTTYYNDTGRAARAILDFYKLDPSADLLVVHDDLTLPFGTIRVRGQGSDAGNNGVKSLNEHIGPSYTRLRIGISNDLRGRIPDTDFVLARFTKDEAAQLTDSIVPHIHRLIKDFAHGSLDITSHTVLKA